MKNTEVSIDDKYTRIAGRVFISGTQALVRLPLMQRQRDVAAGHNTAGYISGYRGSPLGTYDSELWKAKRFLKAEHIHFEAGVNEDLAATAIMGTQQAHTYPGARYDGVFGIWYGKGPGVDRSGDPFKHGNIAGTAEYGGVLVVFGDDHAGKSSTVSHQSEQALAAHSIPVLYPATIQDYIDFGLLGWAMSRYTGLWVGLKCVNETVENTASVDIDPARSAVVLPIDDPLPSGGVNFIPAFQKTFAPAEDEMRLVRYKMPRIHTFARVNRIDRVAIDGPHRRFGIVAAGKSYLDVQQALQLLGLDHGKAVALGISLYKPGLIWPMEPEGIRNFSRGLQELFFVEEKRAFMEDQVARLLYDTPQESRPRIIGKLAPDGTTLLPSDIVLDAQTVARSIGRRLQACGITDADVLARLENLDGLLAAKRMLITADVMRTPFFCSGCPHNVSTVVPEGSMALGGIGCHGMAIFMDRSLRSTQMGGEGLNWAGVAPFTDTPHVFQNLGDGTYSHSGLLAIHGSIAARTNITYKILYNDAVAMTGGQPVEGGLSVKDITLQTAGLGATAIRVVTDEPEKYGSNAGFASGVTVHHRDQLDQIQRELREVKGTSILIYDQTCAAEKRRRRKRGTMIDPGVRAFINEAVCEGCGDCSVKANCVSIEPLETELGRKRRIDQASCNKDLSCINGFCPSFVTVHGGTLRKPRPTALDDALLQAIPAPLQPAIDGSFNVLINGVGGTGVVTIGAVLGMAAHLEGKGASVFDMTGMAQKGGAVFSHLKIAMRPEDVNTVAIGSDEADLLLGCDLLVSGSRDALRSIRRDHTRVVLNTHLVPTGAFQRRPDIDFQVERATNLVREAVGAAGTCVFDANALAVAYAGNSVASNMIAVGCAYQMGALPLSAESIERAIELNGISIDFNKRAFALGRLYIHDPSSLAVPEAASVSVHDLPLDEYVVRRIKDLNDYQNEQYGNRYATLIAAVSAAERRVAPGRNKLANAVARAYFKLLAYKDEYEVARLYTNGDFEKNLAAQFEGDFSLSFHLAPPIFSKKDPATGHAVKRPFGPYTFQLLKLLTRMRVLRGTALDVFGYNAERRQERALIKEYEATVQEILASLNAINYDIAVTLAALPLDMRGFGHVKDANVRQTRQREDELKQAFRSPPVIANAA